MSGACCCAVQRQRQWLLRCCKSQQWICRPLSGSPCASTSRVSILFGTSWDFLACSSAINPLLLAIPLVCFVRWTCSFLLCCAHIFASSTRTGGTEHELLCCKIWPQQCLDVLKDHAACSRQPLTHMQLRQQLSRRAPSAFNLQGEHSLWDFLGLPGLFIGN